MNESMLLDAIIYLGAAVVCVPIAKALKLGSVLGYLIAGCIIGPFGLGIGKDPEATLHFAEIGVVLMLFVIGLELDVRHLWTLRLRGRCPTAVRRRHPARARRDPGRLAVAGRARDRLCASAVVDGREHANHGRKEPLIGTGRAHGVCRSALSGHGGHPVARAGAVARRAC